AVLELIHVTVARPFGFGKNNQAGATIDCVLRQPPHALQIRRPPHIRNRHVAEALHQPAVRRNLEVRLQLPPAHKLRDGAVQDEWVEEIHVVGHEEARPLRIETRRPHYFHARARQKSDAAAGRTSSARHSTVITSPSIMTSTGAASLNSTWRTARREASGCLI